MSIKLRRFAVLLLGLMLVISSCRSPLSGDEESGESSEFSAQGAVSYQEIYVDETKLNGCYYYSLLSDEEKQIYQELISGLMNHEEKIITHGSDPDLVNRVFTCCYLDCPEMFWLDGNVKTTGYSGIVNYCKVVPGYSYTFEESQERTARVEEAAQAIFSNMDENWSSYDKIYYIYRTLVAQTEYELDSEDNQNICSVLLNGKSVCAGYARTFQYLMQKLNIYCIYVTGTICTGEYHAWNIVQCGDDYYNVDVTWGDPVFATEQTEGTFPQNLIYYDFLCCSDRELASTHTPDPSYTYPSCVNDDLEYYRLAGRYFDSADYDTLLGVLEQDIANQDSYSELKFGSEEAYADAQGSMDSLLDEAAYYLCDLYQIHQVTYYYSLDDVTHKIIVFWNYTESS